MNNDKIEGFQRLSRARVVKVTDALDVLGNCSNKSAYEYTEDDITEMFGKIEEKVRQTKSRFKLEPAVLVPGDNKSKTWKQLASSLKSHGSLNHDFSKTQWGHHCVRFYVRDSIFWITCYTADFKDADKRRYGIFISYPGFFQRSNMSVSQKAAVDSLRSLLIKNSDAINSVLPDAYIADKDADDGELAGWTRDLSEFPSDEAAIEWLKSMLDTYSELVVPLIKQV